MAITRELETIPGTEVLLFSNGNISEHSGNADKLVLVPEPSNDPDDPLVSSILYSYPTPLTGSAELEPNMEIHRHHQPSNLRLHLRSHATLDRTVDTDLHPRVPQDNSAS
jgi:hypothetical protein